MKRIYPYLATAGTIPFIACTAGLIFDIKQFPPIFLQNVLSAYTLVIVAFLAGSHWGQHLQIQEYPQEISKRIWGWAVPILSNVISVLLWLGFLILDFKILMVLCIFAFVILLGVDQCLFYHDFITRQYFQTRCFVSVIVISMLIISIAVV